MIPNIRFPGFNKEYSQVALNEIFDRIKRKIVNNQSVIPLTIASIEGLVDQRTYFGKTIASKDMSGYYLLKKGEFAYNKSYSKGFPVGSIKRLDKYEQGALSTLYICFALKENAVDYDSDYLVQYFNSNYWNHSVSEVCAEGARNHGLLNVSPGDFFSTIHNLPPSIPEQKKIADFLFAYDEKIRLQRERVETLERRKKGLLQKIFSQEIRFKADNGTEYPEWSNSTFSSVFTSVGNNTFSRSDLTSDNSSNIRNIHYGDVLIKYGEIINTEVDSIPYIKKNISLSNNNDKLLQNGDIVFADTAEDNTVGKACEIALSDFRDKIVSGLHTIAVRPTIQFASGYLGYFLNSSLFHDQLLPLIQGIKVSSISKKALFEETRVYYPSYQEQQKISDLFTIISEQIKVERERLSTMETIKNGLLQGLFC